MYFKYTLDFKLFIKKIEDFCRFKYFYAIREEYQDGTPHYHILGKWTKKRNFRNPYAFNIKGFHPNIGSTRN
ncbi:uncharacterized protein F4812DRAFT_432864 [Daldinia caldariorum]|uniref:uncharacterized protein n=1 Tax=Daldinia caldariorum TaxID=326644 RepID=UPI00200722FA|nr:uncharacterized protein F4812DRAFT_432864 [Daldinia caldariorum]KAI1466806.1 hypothetical protein F4812DRAFT_432864 [Daldinia caldariorum]